MHEGVAAPETQNPDPAPAYTANAPGTEDHGGGGVEDVIEVQPPTRADTIGRATVRGEWRALMHSGDNS